MPKKLQYTQLDDNKYQFESKLSYFSGSNCIIRSPTELGKIYNDKKVRVTIEVLEDE